MKAAFELGPKWPRIRAILQNATVNNSFVLSLAETLNVIILSMYYDFSQFQTKSVINKQHLSEVLKRLRRNVIKTSLCQRITSGKTQAKAIRSAQRSAASSRAATSSATRRGEGHMAKKSKRIWMFETVHVKKRQNWKMFIHEQEKILLQENIEARRRGNANTTVREALEKRKTWKIWTCYP